MLRCNLILLAGLALASAALHASYLEEPAEARPAPPVRVIPEPPDDPLTQAIRRLDIERPHHYKGLTVFALTARKVADDTGYLSLSDALAEELVVITEKGSGSVPRLLAENRSSRFVLMLAGEVVTGGKQNRTLQQDLLLPPKSGRVELPVFCVEQRRWSGPEGEFRKSPSVAALGVRNAAQAGKSQDAVWGNVRSYQEQLRVDSSTADLQDVNEAPDVQRAVRDYVGALKPYWPRDAVGMVVARQGRIVGADFCCSPALFREHRDRLLESYALDCYALRTTPRGPIVGTPPELARRFLERAMHARHTWTATPGAGRLMRVSGHDVTGLALVRKDAVLHAGLFPQEPVIRPVPIERPLRRLPTD